MRAFILAALAILVLPLTAAAGDLQEKWVQVGCNFSDDASVDNMISVMQQAARIGCTHITFRDPRFGYIERMPQHYLDNCKRVRDAAAAPGLTLVPGIFPIGYSGGYLVHDANLAAGLPVKNAPFIVSGGVARPDPAAVPAIVNGGFDDVAGGLPSGWTVDPALAGHVKADTTVTHSGAASLCEFDLGSLPPGTGGNCIVTQNVAVAPFQYYVLSVWIKTENFYADEFRLFIRSHNGKRDHCYTSPRVGGWQDWTLCQFTFNTLDATEISIGLGAETCYWGALWWDDLTVEPAGLANVLRTKLKPLKITSADGAKKYVEGRDFERVKDPAVGDAPSDDPNIFPFPYDVWHQGPNIVLTSKSRIREGDTILVSYYHPHLIYWDQVSISIEDPKVFKLMDRQMRLMHAIWRSKAYFMAYDEVRMGGWERQPLGRHLTPGQLLARHVRKAVKIARKYAPRAKLYTWSDMFDPYHNARAIGDGGGYYLVNGDWSSSWNGLPSSVRIVNWIGRHDSMEWFGARGHRQVMAGYYDGDPASNVAMWRTAAGGVPNVVGMMYTTWSNNYSQLANFFQIVDSYDGW